MATEHGETGFFRLSNTELTAVVELDDVILVEARAKVPVFDACCTAPALVRNGYRSPAQTINDVPHDKPVVIHYRTARAKCRACGRDVSEAVPHKHGGWQMTERLYRMLGREALIDTSAGVARRTGVAANTVRQVRDAHLEAGLARRSVAAPRVLGIDNTKIGVHWVAVIGDITGPGVIDLLPRHGVPTFLAGLRDRHRVRVVCTDLRWGYVELVRRWFPTAAHVADKFHVVRRANYALEETCTALRRRYAPRIDEQIRSIRPLLKRREHSLTEHERERVAESLGELPPLLKAAYRAKEDFYGMYERCGSAEEAARYYRSWRQALGVELEQSFTRRCVPHEAMLKAVFNYFDHPFTNAYVESVNRHIADLRRQGRGYDFETLRGMVLLAPKLEHRVFRGAGAL